VKALSDIYYHGDEPLRQILAERSEAGRDWPGVLRMVSETRSKMVSTSHIRFSESPVAIDLHSRRPKLRAMRHPPAGNHHHLRWCP
jgi:hypothetical protein